MAEMTPVLDSTDSAVRASQQAGAATLGTAAWAAVIGGGLLRLWLAIDDHSIYWPDEIYQSLEQAHRLAFGYGLVPWEFRDGARSWIMPGMLAAVWKFASGLGVTSSMNLVVLARFGMVLSSVVAAWLVARVATQLGGARAGWVSALALAVMPASVVFSYRAMTETLSTPFIMLAVVNLLAGSRQKAALSGVFATFATLLRYQNGAFAAAFVVWLVMQRRLRCASAFCIASLACAAIGGLLDWVTWGSPFHSLTTYIEFNLIADGASSFGVEPAWYYVKSLWDSTGPAMAIWAALALAGAFRAPALAIISAVYLLLHSAIPHKELRFISPSLPFWAVLIGLGAERAYQFVGRRPAPWWGVLAIATCGTSVSLATLSYGRLGQYLGTPRAAHRVWNAEEDVNLLLADAGKLDDICGLAALGVRAAFTGGYTYFHKPVPLVYSSGLCDAAVAVNYVLAPRTMAATSLPSDYSMVRERGALALFRRNGECAPLPSAYDNLLEGAHNMGLRRTIPEQTEDGRIQIDMIRSSGAFENGWGNGEIIDCQRGRWATNTRASIRVSARNTSTPYSLTLRLRAYDGKPDQSVKISINQVLVYEDGLSPTAERLHVDVPRGTLVEGDNAISFEFARSWSPGGDDQRQLAAFIEELDLSPASDDFSVDVGNPDHRSHLLHGFSTDETEADISFSWSDGAASDVIGTLIDPTSPHVLSITAQAISWLVPQRVRVSFNDRPLGVWEIGADWTHQGMLVPPAFVRRGANRLHFEYSGTVTPSSRDTQSEDTRELAVRFDSIHVKALSPMSALDLGTPQARSVMLRGWSNDEKEEARSVVWSIGSASVLAVAFADDAPRVLKVDARAYAPALPVRVIVALNGVAVDTFEPTAQWATHEIVLPSRYLSTGGSILEFRFDHTTQPASHEPGSEDRRDIAVQFDKLVFTNVIAPTPLPP